MLKKISKIKIIMIALALLTTSCASISPHQKQDLADWESKGIKVEEKNETTAAVLNVLPGIGDFYNGYIGLGIANLLLWPASIIWAPVGGSTGAEARNYIATKAYITKLESKRTKLLAELDSAYMVNSITKKTYVLGKNKINNMDISEFKESVKLESIIPMTSDKRFPASK